MTCYVSPLYSRVKGESHASVCGSRSHTLIPTGARSRPAAIPKPIIISVPRPHCWKGSASKPYVELPPHTAPLGMEVGPAQACAVKVVVHDLIRKRKKIFLHEPALSDDCLRKFRAYSTRAISSIFVEAIMTCDDRLSPNSRTT